MISAVDVDQAGVIVSNQRADLILEGGRELRLEDRRQAPDAGKTPGVAERCNDVVVAGQQPAAP